MSINKVQYGTDTLIDLTNDTVTPEKILLGYTAHDKAGEIITGVAAGEITIVHTLEEFNSNYDAPDGFILSYNNATDGIKYVTNTVTTAQGVFEETSEALEASAWYFEAAPQTDRYYIYSIIDNEQYYIYNNTSAGANFTGLSTTTKHAFLLQETEDESKFNIKLSTANKWLQHSNSGKGIRFYTDANNAANSRFTITYKQNAIVPYGTLTITENGTYNISNYKNVIINVN